MKVYRMPIKEVPDGPPMPDGQQPILKYKELLLILLKHPRPGQGIRKKEIKQRMLIQRQVEKAETELVMGEKEWNFLKDLASNFLWGSATAPLEEFLDDLDNAQPLTKEEEAAYFGEERALTHSEA